ncbi:MAG: YgiW/YdeI family stress tolerance OB fold protein [Deltaproteobacteria bacterium]|jgi:uncharacterized protein (TIGR00156 family)|nr:YgiW/YdeI family stress tolerance OB fold protein [Deltaproteobacteria bacterium]
MMKYVLPILIFGLLALSPQLSLAQDGGFQGSTVAKPGGGFTGPGLEVVTVGEALRQGDDTPVILKGQIVRHLGKDRYLFRDATGEITVDIDDDKWNGLNITPNDTIEIRGEVDKDWTSIEIDVDSVAKIS